MELMNVINAFKDAFPTLIQGMGATLRVTCLALVLAFIIGIFACLFRISKIKPLQWISRFYLWLIRGTPMIVQAFYIYFAVPQLIRMIFDLDRFTISIFLASLITLTLNAGAYMSEIFRGAIESVNKGQMEAARSLGLSYSKSMVKIILPQAVRICLPSLVNQCIITLKDSTILYAIGLQEIMYYGNIYVGRTFNTFATYTLIAIMFLVVVTFLSFVSRRIERRIKC